MVKFWGSWKTVKGSFGMSWDSGAELPLDVDKLDETALLVLSMESVSIASVGGTGERTSVIDGRSAEALASGALWVVSD